MTFPSYFKIRWVFAIALISVTSLASAQDLSYARTVVDTLCHPVMHGRGYYEDGDKRAATYIANEFNRLKLKRFGSEFFQFFPMPVNTFPGKVEVAINGQPLSPGKAFLLHAFSGGASGEYPILTLNSKTVRSQKSWDKFRSAPLEKSFVLVDGADVVDKEMQEMLSVMAYNPVNAAGIITLEDKKLTYGVSNQAAAHPAIHLLRDSLPENPKKITVNIEQEFRKEHRSQNVIGYVPGYLEPDSFVVFTAHYDHLGRMGSETIFPGANDNASGTAMLLDLAKHYLKHPPAYNVVFMAFGGEEVGLIGSKYYVENPLFPLKNIKFLINIDLMGNGSKGITAVNGKVLTKEFEKLKAINAEKNYLPEVKARGKAANSDHHYFSEQGVPAFFIYSRGNFNAYHDVDDVAKDLPFEEYDNLFRLITDFAASLR